MIKELPFIHFQIDGNDYYGGDQEWFDSQWAKQAGCASVLASNLFCYYGHHLDMSLMNFRIVMDQMFDIFTPGVMGFPFYKKFAAYFSDFMKAQGHELETVMYRKTENPVDGFAFVKDCIDQGMPVGMLILTHRHKDIEEETWHWMCITGYTEDETKKEVIVSSCGEKVTLNVNALFDPHPMNVVRMLSFKDVQDQSSGTSSVTDTVS